MGAAKDAQTCATVVFDQVSSVGQMAVFVGTLGGSGAASTAGGAARNAGKLATMQKKYREMVQAYEKAKNTERFKQAKQLWEQANNVKDAHDAYVTLDNMASATTEEDMARYAMQLAAIVDPTGVAGTVAAYTYPKCSKLFPGQ